MHKKIVSLLMVVLTFMLMISASAATYPDSITHHQILLHGKTYHYTTQIGTITLYDKHQHATATMSYTADTLDTPASKNRPITFFYNGGPGASSMLLRMASFGPKRVVLNGFHPISPAPYETVDNAYSLLDKTDLVFIDMPGTGFGRLMPHSDPTHFYGVDKDANAFAQFIQTYISTHHRWNSPKFLYGESYGSTRTAVLVNKLQHRAIQINGVVLQSSIINYALMGDRVGGGDWQFVLTLPSLAAISWYFHASDYHPNDLSTLLREVEHFALTDYLGALAQGSKLSKQKTEQLTQKLHLYLGLSEDTIRHLDLRIPSGTFSRSLRYASNERLGRFDGRFAIYSLNRGRSILTIQPDPSTSTLHAALLAANHQYFHNDLHYNNPLYYRPGIFVYKNWNFQHAERSSVNASFDLANAMVENPDLRVFSANGYYDLATPYFSTVYTLDHLCLPSQLQKHITYGFYPAGHMIYLELENLKKLRHDLGAWYDATLSVKKHPKV